MDPVAAIERLIGVYDADGGLRGELAYVLGHLVGRTECALCDITHSAVRRRRSWDALVADLPVPLVAVHRNELPVDLVGVGAPDRLPAVYAVRSDRSVDELITRDELAGMGGSVDRFAVVVRSRLGAG